MVLDGNKNTIEPKRYVKTLPRVNEMIYIDKNDKYYNVINVIHRYSHYRFFKFIKNEGYFIIVEEFNKK